MTLEYILAIMSQCMLSSVRPPGNRNICQLTQAVIMSSAGTYYEVLGVKQDASTTEIMNAYNSKVQKVFSLHAWQRQLLKITFGTAVDCFFFAG